VKFDQSCPELSIFFSILIKTLAASFLPLLMNSENGAFCFIDIDVDNFRLKLGTAAAFVDATDSRYGLSSKKLFLLGGSEIARLQDMIETDHGTNFLGINIY
jgi:hypothetical protein